MNMNYTYTSKYFPDRNRKPLFSPKGENNPRSKEIEIYRDEKLVSIVKGLKELSRNSEKILGRFIAKSNLAYHIRTNKPLNGFVLKYKEVFVF